VLVQRQCIVLPAPVGLPDDQPALGPKPVGASPVVRALFRVHPPGPLAHRPPKGCRLPAPLLEFATPSTLEPGQVHSTPVCLAGYVPPPGFLTLTAACSLPGRPALFHAGNALGVSRSSGVSPHCQVPRLVAVELPSWRFSSGRLRRGVGANEAFEPTSHDGMDTQTFAAFKALLRQWIRLTQTGGPLRMIDPLLSFLSLSRVLPIAPGVRSAAT